MSFIDWKDIFDDIFEAYPDKWSLNQMHRNNVSQLRKLQTKRTMERQAYARFHCPKCQITSRFYGQQCKKCSRNGNYFVDPEYDTDEIKFILEKLYERIGWNCYGKKRPPKTTNTSDKEIDMKGPHEKSLCEACQLGCCDRALTMKKR
ncbi:unnamed protein product [Adineta steineri]|uniref:3CxxC-type domain-containing protein n=1 Tax=Adineta steineri TaxID=433720 RepID=A0A814MSX9_9BILA|nr:unnamed protein product [Adineta steineri]CAF1218337.1 unnamed protein product [Adineta steineri]